MNRALKPRELLSKAPRFFAVCVLFLGFTLVLELFLLSAFEPGNSLLSRFLSDSRTPAATLVGSTLVCVSLVVIALVYLRVRPRTPRSWSWFGVSLLALVTVDLWVCASLPALLYPGSREAFDIPIVLGGTVYLVMLVLILPLMVLKAAVTLGRRSWRGIAAGYAVLVPILAFLGHDDAAIRRNVTLAEIGPDVPEAARSNDLLMRFSSRVFQGNRQSLRANRIWRVVDRNMSVDPGRPEEFRRFLEAGRAAIEADWADITPIRDWWTELAQFDQLGDTNGGEIDKPVISFEPVRTYSQLAVAVAGLQALAGDGDAAFATLQPLLEVSRKLEPGARSLVRMMIARVAQKNAISAAAFVLDTTAVSQAARNRFAAALATGTGGEEGARRLIEIEYALRLARAGDFPDPSVQTILPEVPGLELLLASGRSLVYNPRRTINELGDQSAELEDLAARRDYAGLRQAGERHQEEQADLRFKNLVGALINEMGSSDYSRVAETYWQIEDSRTSLLVRLAAS